MKSDERQGSHMKNVLSFKGKNAMVTGGSRGIGHAIALGLASRGANVCISYSKSDGAAKETVESMSRYGVNAVSYKIDQNNIEEIPGLFRFAEKNIGDINILVNNAGICPFKDFFEIDRELLESVWRVNFESHFILTQLVSERMIEDKIEGRILFISSISSRVGGEFQTHYTPTKSAINGLVHSLSIVLGKNRILVNSLEPGTILTDINREDLSNRAKRKYMEKRVAIGRIGRPEDMVWPALFLVSDENTYVTGTELLADGGMLVNLQ